MTIGEMNKLRHLARDIRGDEARLQELRAKRDAGGLGGGMGSALGHSGPGDPTARLATEIANLELSIMLDTARKLHEEQVLRGYIEQAPDPTLRLAMKARFIECRSWAAAARAADPSGINTADAVRMAVKRYLDEH